jgi:hypothetical protein
MFCEGFLTIFRWSSFGVIALSLCVCVVLMAGHGIPSCVAILCRQGPTIQSQFKTQSESIRSHDGRRKLAKHNNHRLRSRKIPEKSRFDEESAAINLQPKTFAECTSVPLKRAIVNTDGRGCVARSLNKGATKRHRNTD